MAKKQSAVNERRARAAAIQAAQARRARMMTLSIGGVVVVVVVILALLLVYALKNNKSDGDGSTTTASTLHGAAPAAVVKGVTQIPSSVYDSVGIGTAQGAPHPLKGQPAMTEDGKPRVLYVGAEFCPYCAAERWALVSALSRFGTFKGIGVTRSSDTDVDADTASLDLKDAKYTSKYIAFAPFENEDRQGQLLQKLSSSDEALFKTIGQGGYPFIDLAGKWAVTGPQYDGSVLGGADNTQTKIAAVLNDPKSKITQAVVGSSNLLTVALCDLTKGQPTSVCNSKGVQTAKTALDAAVKKSQ